VYIRAEELVLQTGMISQMPVELLGGGMKPLENYLREVEIVRPKLLSYCF
jgi:hypothetical protein